MANAYSTCSNNHHYQDHQVGDVSIQNLFREKRIQTIFEN